MSTLACGQSDDWNDRHTFIDIPGMFTSLSNAGLACGLPIHAWIKDRPLSLVWVQIVTFMFCFPLALVQYYGSRDTPIKEAAWALSLYFAILGAAILHRCIHPEPIGMGRMFGVWLFTGLFGVEIVLVFKHFAAVTPLIRDAFATQNSDNIIYRFLHWTIAVGAVEESIKTIPLVWIVSRSTRSLHPNTSAFLGCISGLAFGSTEAVLYSLDYAFQLQIVDSTLPVVGNYLLIQVLRFVSLPLLHAIWTGILGYFISLTKFYPNSRISIYFSSLLSVSVLHGAYDFTVAEGIPWGPFAIALLSLLFFVGYIRNSFPLAVISKPS